MNLETFIDLQTGTELYGIYRIDYAKGVSYRLYNYWNNKVIYESEDLEETKVIGYNLADEFNKISDEEIEQFINDQKRIANNR